MPESRLVAALAYPDVQLLDITGPVEAFNLAAQQLLDDGEATSRAYEFAIITRDGAPQRSMSGLTLSADRSLADPVDDIDTLIIPGALTGGHPFYRDPEYIDWLRTASRRVRRVCSICSGALLLAAAGLLQGRRATTHWMDAAELSTEFSGVRVEANRIYTEDRGVYTSGGITAGIDLALALIEKDFSRRLALKTAKRMLVFLKRPGGQSQFSSFLAAQTDPGPFSRVLDWITEHLDEPLETARLASLACMSERSFLRKFEAAQGKTLRDYLRAARVNKAMVLLESTASSLKLVARQCGFVSEDAMRYAFSVELGVTPREYRLRFGASAQG